MLVFNHNFINIKAQSFTVYVCVFVCLIGHGVKGWTQKV